MRLMSVRILGLIVTATLIAGCSGSAPAATRSTRSPELGARPRVVSYDGAVVVRLPQGDSHPAVSREQATTFLANSASADASTVRPVWKLGLVTVVDSRRLVQPWLNRLAWYVNVDSPVRDQSFCPFRRGPADAPPPGPQRHVYAVDATGVGDGFFYLGPGISCGHRYALGVRPLGRLWSAPWRIVALGRGSWTLAWSPPGCGTLHSSQAVSLSPYEWAELYEVPYGAAGCPRRPELTVGITGTARNLQPPRFGWVRQVNGGLVTPLPDRPS